MSEKTTIPERYRYWKGRDFANNEISYAEMHELMHRDIAIGNQYRQERIKLLGTLATGILALTITFHKDLFQGRISTQGLWFVGAGWVCLLISILSGILHFGAWEKFYMQYRDTALAVWTIFCANAHPDVAKDADAAIHTLNDAAAMKHAGKSEFTAYNWIQTSFLLLGLALILLYVLPNLNSLKNAWGAGLITDVPAASTKK